MSLPRPIPPVSTTIDPATGLSELAIVRQLHKHGMPGMTLAEFVVWAWPIVESRELVWGWHMQVLCDHVQAQAEGGRFGKPWVQNTLINISPGTTKSLIVSVLAGAWIWTWDPGRKRFHASANPDVSTRDSIKARLLIGSDEYRDTFKPNWRLTDDQNAKTHFTNTAGGFRQAKGVGGKITGNRADDLVVDDPLDASDAYSETVRHACNVEWWDDSVGNRLNDMQTGTRTIIMQRLHEDDLAGHVLEQGNWDHLVIPMEYEKVEDRACKCKSCASGKTFLGWSDPRTVPGELMFPSRFPMSVLKGENFPIEIGGELRRLGPTGYAGQYQQRPTSAVGNMFKREHWRFWSRDGVRHPRPRGASDLPPLVLPYGQRFDNEVQSWDCAFKDLSTSDYVCGGVVCKLGGKRIVMPDLFMKQVGFLGTVEAVLKMRQDHPLARKILIEDKANGTAVIEVLKTKITGVEAVEPEGGKEARAAAALPIVEAGDVYLPEGAPWLEEWFDIFSAFPTTGKKDDPVDFLSQALRSLEPTSDMQKAALLCGWIGSRPPTVLARPRLPLLAGGRR